jgi:hypothetical protein
VNSESALFHDGVGPEAGHQLPLFDDFARALYQEKENLLRPAAQSKGRARAKQHPLRGIKPEGSERDLLTAACRRIAYRHGVESLYNDSRVAMSPDRLLHVLDRMISRNEPVKTCSGEILTGETHGNVDGRNQHMDGAA